MMKALSILPVLFFASAVAAPPRAKPYEGHEMAAEAKVPLAKAEAIALKARPVKSQTRGWRRKPTARGGPSSVRGQGQARPMKLLLVEDDRQAAGYLKRALAEAGHAVNHAASGRDGLMLAAVEPYDVPRSGHDAALARTRERR